MMKKGVAVTKYTIQLHRASSNNNRVKNYPTLFAFFCDCARRISIKMHWDIRKAKATKSYDSGCHRSTVFLFSLFEMYGNFGQVVRSCESHSSAFITRSTSTPTLD